MKRIWASGIILVIALVLCVLGIVKTHSVTSELVQTVTSAKAAGEAGNKNLAYELSNKAVADWRKDHEILCMFMPHAKLEAIDQTLAALPGYIKYDGEDQFVGECDRGITQINYLNESEIPNIQNIF